MFYCSELCTMMTGQVIVANQNSLNFLRPKQVLMRWIKKSATTQHRKTRRWRLAVFYNILDLLAYNAFVLYKLWPPVVPGINMISHAWLGFLYALEEQLIKPNMLQRAQYTNDLNVPTIRALEALSVAIDPQNQARALDGLPQKKHCMVCPRSSEGRVRQQCKECKRNICNEHSKTILMSTGCFTA